jgi:hypothetical protein
MTPQISQAADKHIESELDRLTYSAYLLTLDPGVAVSVVMTAIEGSLEEITFGPELLERTVELALEQLRRESAEWDGESSAFDAVLYGHSAAINSPVFQSLKDLSGNPILVLDSTSRIAFVLHHVLGYMISDAAAKARLSEKQYRAQLRRAYLQLASLRLQGASPTSHGAEQSEPTWERSYELVEMDSCLFV